MNKNDVNDIEFTPISLNILNSNKISRDITFYILLANTIFVLILLTLILNPSKTIRHYFLKFIHISIFKIKLYHIFFLTIISLYSYLYLGLKDDFESIDTEQFNFSHERLLKFNRVYEIESKIWMVFIIIICLLSIYRNAFLINKEEQIMNNN